MTGRGLPPSLQSMTIRTILCFGDSNTWGFIPGSDCERYAPDARWPGVMAAALGAGWRVVEEAQNGRMTAWRDPSEPFVNKCGLDFLPVALESHKPLDLVIIMLGTNDLKEHMHHTARSIAIGAGALGEVVQASDAGPGKKAPRVLLVCPAAVAEGRCPFGRLFDHAPPISREMPEAYREMAESLGVAFLNAGDYATCPVPDCIHLDDVGHAALGKAMAAKVREIFG